MKPLSDDLLRKSAWVVSLTLLASVAVGIPLGLSAENTTTSETVVEVGFVLMILAFPLTGAVIIRRQPRNRVAWLLQAIGAVWALGAISDAYDTYGAVVNPGSLPFSDYAAAFNQVSWAPGLGLTGTLLILLYPDGRLPSPRWRLVAWLSVLTICTLTVSMLLTPARLEMSPDPTQMNPLGWESAKTTLASVTAVCLAMFPVAVIACMTGLVVRFRRSRGIERLQLKWLATAAVFVALTFPLSMLAPRVVKALTGADTLPESYSALDTLSLISFALLPLAIGTAILRHRLYDIDLVIKRTLVYATLTALLAGVYLGAVLLLQVLLSPLTHQSDLAVAGSTLTVAALFGPARRRIQTAVDRRFNRNRYDAAATLEAFTARLRDQVDLEAVGTELRSVIAQTLQPADVRLWIRS